MDVVHGEKSLILALRALLRPAIRRGLVVAVFVGTVLDDRVDDSDLGGGMIGVRSKDTDPVTRKVPNLHALNVNVPTLSYEMNPTDIDAFRPHLVASDDRSPLKSQVVDILSEEELPVRSALIVKEESRTLHSEHEVGVNAQPGGIRNAIGHRRKYDLAAGRSGRIDGLLNLRLVADRAIGDIATWKKSRDLNRLSG